MYRWKKEKLIFYRKNRLDWIGNGDRLKTLKDHGKVSSHEDLKLFSIHSLSFIQYLTYISENTLNLEYSLERASKNQREAHIATKSNHV